MNKWDRKTGFCCRSCYVCAPVDEEKGRCRRHAPTMTGYPVVYLDSDWCGDHKIGSNPSKDAYAENIRLEKAEEWGRDFESMKKQNPQNTFQPMPGGSGIGCGDSESETTISQDVIEDVVSQIVHGCVNGRFSLETLHQRVYERLGVY